MASNLSLQLRELAQRLAWEFNEHARRRVQGNRIVIHDAVPAGEEFIVSHGMGDVGVIVSFCEVDTGRAVQLEWRRVTSANIAIYPDVSYPESALSVTVTAVGGAP